MTELFACIFVIVVVFQAYKIVWLNVTDFMRKDLQRQQLGQPHYESSLESDLLGGLSGGLEVSD